MAPKSHSRTMRDAVKARMTMAFARHMLRPRSFARFVLVGGVNTVVGIGAFPVFYAALKGVWGVNALLALSWAASTAFAFLSHKMFTFCSRGPAHREGAKFLVLALATLGLNFGAVNLAMRLCDADPVIAQVATSCVVMATMPVVNYFGMDRVIFRARPPV